MTTNVLGHSEKEEIPGWISAYRFYFHKPQSTGFRCKLLGSGRGWDPSLHLSHTTTTTVVHLAWADLQQVLLNRCPGFGVGIPAQVQQPCAGTRADSTKLRMREGGWWMSNSTVPQLPSCSRSLLIKCVFFCILPQWTTAKSQVSADHISAMYLLQENIWMLNNCRKCNFLCNLAVYILTHWNRWEFYHWFQKKSFVRISTFGECSNIIMFLITGTTFCSEIIVSVTSG